ncbi:MAG: S41 family peptidase [Treponema sp.]|nr:S41 family peptidase [Treponema sp.]
MPQIAAAFLALLLAACQRPDPPAGIPAHLLEIIEANRAIALPPFPEDFRERADAFLTQGLTHEEDVRVSRERRRAILAPNEGIREIFPDNDPARSISREEASEDLRFLFDLMKYAYAGYQYFGGDDVFLPIRDSMLERLAEMESPLAGLSFLNDILVPGLWPAIADNHFQLHDVTLGAPRRRALMSEEFVLRKGSDGYSTKIDGDEYRLVEAALGGQKVEGVLPTLTREGEAAYAFGHFADWNQLGIQALSVTLESLATGDLLTLALRLWPLPSFDWPTTLFHQYETNGVPVVVNRTLSYPYATSDATKIFRESGASLRGAPVVLLDLRGNGGGLPNPMLFWIGALTGNWSLGRAFGVFNFRSMSNGLGSGPRWTTGLEPFVSAPALPNESLIIALTDNNIGSAGDLIVGHLRELENVIFVGTNTKGALVTGGVVRNVLPHSGIAVIFGIQLHLRPDFSQFEGVGFMPDLWVPPDQSLHRVLAFIERYGLLRGAK